MRPMSVAVPPKAPTGLSGVVQDNGVNQQVVLTWTDASINETGFLVQRALTSTGPWTDLATVGENITTYTDVITDTIEADYYYQVVAINQLDMQACPAIPP